MVSSTLHISVISTFTDQGYLIQKRQVQPKVEGGSEMGVAVDGAEEDVLTLVAVLLIANIGMVVVVVVVVGMLSFIRSCSDNMSSHLTRKWRASIR